MATGEKAGTWGDITNSNIGTLLEAAVAGLVSVAVTGGAYSLTTNNGAADQARNAMIKFTGVLGSASTVTIPAKNKIYIVWNATTGAYTLTLTAGGVTVAVTQGQQAIVFCDGTDCYKLLETGASFAVKFYK